MCSVVDTRGPVRLWALGQAGVRGQMGAARGPQGPRRSVPRLAEADCRRHEGSADEHRLGPDQREDTSHMSRARG